MEQFKYTEYTRGHLIFLILFTLFTVIVLIANWVNYSNIDNDDDKVNIGVNQYTFTVFYIFNIIFVFVSIFALIYFIVKIFSSKNVYTDLLPDTRIGDRTVSEIINGNSPEKAKEILKKNECKELGINEEDKCKQYNMELGTADKVKYYLNNVREPNIKDDDKAINVIENVCNFKEGPENCVKKIRKIDETIKSFKQDIKSEILQLIPDQDKITKEKNIIDANLAVYDGNIGKLASEKKQIESEINKLETGIGIGESLDDLKDKLSDAKKEYEDSFRLLQTKESYGLTYGTSSPLYTSITTDKDTVEKNSSDYATAYTNYMKRKNDINNKKSESNRIQNNINLQNETKIIYDKKKEKNDEKLKQVNSKLNYLNKSLAKTPKKFEKYKDLYESVKI